MQSTLILYSSGARDGNTGKLTELLKAYYGADALYLDDYDIHPYRYCHKHKDDDFRPLLEKALQYEHWVFASPVYWSSMTSTMKAFFDRITEYMDNESLRQKLRTVRQKRASVYSTSAGQRASHAFIGAFEESFQHLGLTLYRMGHLDCTEGFDSKHAEALVFSQDKPAKQADTEAGKTSNKAEPKHTVGLRDRLYRLFNGVMAKK